jgi:serine/threonine-protein kinase HipA
MRQAKVFYKRENAGLLVQYDSGKFMFRYHDYWFTNPQKPSISLTLNKSSQEHNLEYLFPFFFNMLPEGENKEVVCSNLRIDKRDHLGILIKTAQFDTIGAIQLREISSDGTD